MNPAFYILFTPKGKLPASLPIISMMYRMYWGLLSLLLASFISNSTTPRPTDLVVIAFYSQIRQISVKGLPKTPACKSKFHGAYSQIGYFSPV